jgi:hypothetical protein
MTVGELGEMMASIPSVQRFSCLAIKLTLGPLNLGHSFSELSYRQRLLIILTTALYEAQKSKSTRIVLMGLDWGLTAQDYVAVSETLRAFNEGSHREILIA